jgi:hypothetical protein
VRILISATALFDLLYCFITVRFVFLQDRCQLKDEFFLVERIIS